MIEQIIKSIADEFRSRILLTSDGARCIEYKKFAWVSEVSELDHTFYNGYPGVFTISQIIPFLTPIAFPIRSQALENPIEIMPHGFHLGLGWYKYVTLALAKDKMRPVFKLLSTTSISEDLYTGVAGDLVTNLVCGEVEEEIIEKNTAVLENCLKDGGFAHGKLGNLYSLTLAAEYFKPESKIYGELGAFLIPILKRLGESEFFGTDYAICSGEISLLIIMAKAQKIFGTAKLPFDRYLFYASEITAKLTRSRQINIPLHLCCGLSGIIDILVSLEEITEQGLFRDLAKKIIAKYFNSENFKNVAYTGLLHGLTGIAYQLSRVYPSIVNGQQYPSLMFPQLLAK